MNDPEILISGRFSKALEGVSPAILNQVYAKTHYLVRLYKEQPKTYLSQYDHVKGLGTNDVLEIDLGGGPRMLVHNQGKCFTMLDVGKHEVVPNYNKAFLATDLRSPRRAPQAFWPSKTQVGRFFGSVPGSTSEVYGNELDPEWVYFLTTEQIGFTASICRSVQRTGINNTKFFFILGGPGTGKTSMLLRLLIDLTAKGRKPAIVLSEAVASYVSSGGKINLVDSHILPADIEHAWYNNEAVANGSDVVLVDDPNEPELIEHILDDAVGTKRAVVVAFDPYQVENDIDDSHLSELVTRYDVQQYSLTKCYRQKANIGKAAKRVIDVIAEATPYRNASKIDAFQSDHVNVIVQHCFCKMRPSCIRC